MATNSYFQIGSGIGEITEEDLHQSLVDEMIQIHRF